MARARLTPTQTILAGLVLATGLPIGAAAQSPSQASPQSPALPRFDLAGYAVWIGADTRDLPGDVYRTWDSTGGGAVSGGFYWTEHVKLEVDFGATGDRMFFATRQLEAPRNGTRYVYESHAVDSRTLSLTTVYQLLHNTWVHPFVGGGVDLDWERRRTGAEIHSYFSSPSGSTSDIERRPEQVTHDQRVRGALTTGAKFYVSPRVFVRTDVRVSFSSQIDAVRWRAGAGIDF